MEGRKEGGEQRNSNGHSEEGEGRGKICKKRKEGARKKRKEKEEGGGKAEVRWKEVEQWGREGERKRDGREVHST